MIAAMLGAFAATHLALLGWSFRFQRPASSRLWILRFMLAGMFYDNFVLTLGNVGVGAAWYAGASTGRFVLHAAALPLLIPYALSALRAAAIPLARRRDVTAACSLAAFAAWSWGFWHDVGQLELVAAETLGHQRLTSLSGLPPLGTIAVNLLLIPLAFILWRRTGWVLLLAGALFILFINAGAGTRPWGYLAGNGAEVAFIYCLLLTERFLVEHSLETVADRQAHGAPGAETNDVAGE